MTPLRATSKKATITQAQANAAVRKYREEHPVPIFKAELATLDETASGQPMPPLEGIRLTIFNSPDSTMWIGKQQAIELAQRIIWLARQ